MKIFLLIIIFCSQQVFATKYYLSNKGNDHAAGTSPGKAWASIPHLNLFINTLIPGDSVLFNRGDVFYGQIATPPNGAPGRFIVFAAYGNGDKPVITGLATFSWKKISGNIWEADCNSGRNLDIVTVKGLAVPMGRIPNKGSYFTVDSHKELAGPIDGKTGSLVSASVPAASLNYTGAEMVLRSTDWDLDRNLITAHLGHELFFNASSNNTVSDGNKFFIQRHPSVLDQQNEWYYNASSHTLRIFSTVNPGTLQVKAATTDYAMNGEGRNYIGFYNLNFQGIDSVALRFSDGHHIKISYCDFDLVGADAIIYYKQSRDSVYNNKFTHINNTAIRVTHTGYMIMRYNDIDGCGLVEGMGLSNNQQHDGIMYENGGDSTQIEYNTVQNVGYCGIRFSGAHTQVRYNFINNYGLTLSDGGGIYANGEYTLPGIRVVERNIVQNGLGNHSMLANTKNGGMPGIYLDDNTGFVDVKNNSINNASRYGIFLHNAVNINITGNKIFDTRDEAAIGLAHDNLGIPVRNIDIKENHLYSTGTVKLFDLSSINNDIASFGKSDYNYFVRSNQGSIAQISMASSNAAHMLPGLQSILKWDTHSTFQTISADSIRFVANPTKNIVAVKLGAIYKTLKNNAPGASVSLAPYSAEILRKVAPAKKQK